MSDLPTLFGPKVILQGDSGSGKTFSLGTLVDWAAQQTPPRPVYILFIEPGLETLLGYWRDRGLPVPENLHWHVIATPSIPLESLLSSAKLVGQLSYESLTKLTDPQRANNNPYYRILECMTNFPDDRTGKKFGNIGGWTSQDIFCIDSLTELSNACMKMVIGTKPTASQPDYGVAQNNLINLLRFFTQGFAPTFVMTAHVQKQTNEITGAISLMVKSIGKALADDIPPLFSEVLYSVREANQWYWDTAAIGVTTKTRYLPIAGKQKPDFALIMNKWAARSSA